MRNREELEQLEEQTLAPYAMRSKDCAGRRFPEPPHPTRTCYQRDRDRIVHSEAFRKLEYKTQVFTIFQGDYYRTRLTHTMEVAQIARTIGRNLRLNEDLIEAIALAHDLGHPPFGHAGEEALDEIMKDAGFAGFNHNKRSFEIVTHFEKRYPSFEGLNLTEEVRVGILKHATAYDLPSDADEVADKNPTLEAKVVDIADSLAYLNHDIDDGLASGYIAEDDLKESSLWQQVLQGSSKIDVKGDSSLHRYHIVRMLIDMQVRDLLQTSDERLKKLDFQSSREGQEYDGAVINYSDTMCAQRKELQDLLSEKLYKHYRVQRMTAKAGRILRDIYDAYFAKPEQLPYTVYPRGKSFSDHEKCEIICNYIAGMTDRFAMEEHKKLFNPYTKV